MKVNTLALSSSPADKSSSPTSPGKNKHKDQTYWLETRDKEFKTPTEKPGLIV
jgi:hypothetical protein